ncbi:DEAD/DEAH box helicase [Legionella clemsonensis]|uniref:DEAD-box ATP-dependent RNA helicase RhpA n=1 Tax=Legionella clemsonensis TaxID=1867846 RepID=A0A222P0L3_9GAMM|nr:DEAD/DEAH box helicase [Legionella clemsonensis]ASQ45361.1 ATP-dependent RNA helicase RhlE [Legionella clemsonensis]
MNFTSLGLIEPLVRAVNELGYLEPSPIQIQAIPAILGGKDVLASAQTGTGKTAGFVLPILQNLKDKPRAGNNRARVLILTPTRELAAQVHESIVQYGCHLTLRSAVVFGGVKINPQMMKLRGGVELLVATPGRLLDLHQQRAIQLDTIDTLVLDEADRMLDMGFIHDIKRIMKLLPTNRQTLLFSATFSEEIRVLVKNILKQPLEIDVNPRNTTAVAVKQTVHPVDKGRKSALLSHLIHTNKLGQTLVFSRTKHGANKLVKQLAQDNIHAAAIHGNKSQSQRTKALAEFKSGKLHILVATDIAARGIDIDQLPCVINFDLPQVAEDYVHRIGRTGRAGASGQAISLVSADEVGQLNAIERLIKRKLNRVDIEEFEPNHHVPHGLSPAQTKKALPQRKKASVSSKTTQKQRFGRRN